MILISDACQRLLEHSFFLRWGTTAVERYENVKLLKDKLFKDETYLDGIYNILPTILAHMGRIQI